MDLHTYIIDQCLIVVPALYIIGMIIKRIPKIPDWTIPFVLLAIGIAACISLSMRPDSGIGIVDAIIQGVLVTGTAVLVNQGVKQISDRK